MRLISFVIFAALSLVVLATIVSLSSCTTLPKLVMPPMCSPLDGAIVCPNATYSPTDAPQFECFLPQDIEPLLERALK